MAAPSKVKEFNELAMKAESLAMENQRLKAQLRVEQMETSIAEDFKTLHKVARKRLEDKILQAYADFDPATIKDALSKRLIDEAHDIADKLLGIDKTWHETRLKDNGRLNTLVGNAVDEILSETLQPMMIEEVKRQVNLKSIKTLVNNAIKERVQSAIRSTAYGNSEMSRSIDALVTREMSKIYEECTKDLDAE